MANSSTAKITMQLILRHVKETVEWESWQSLQGSVNLHRHWKGKVSILNVFSTYIGIAATLSIILPKTTLNMQFSEYIHVCSVGNDFSHNVAIWTNSQVLYKAHWGKKLLDMYGDPNICCPMWDLLCTTWPCLMARQMGYTMLSLPSIQNSFYVLYETHLSGHFDRLKRVDSYFHLRWHLVNGVYNYLQY